MADPSLIAKSKIEYAKPAPMQSGKGISVLVFLAFFFLVAVGLVYGGIVLYKRSIDESLISLTRELSKLEEELNTKDIENISRVDHGLLTARSLLSRHIYTSQLFKVLEENTLADVYYTAFTYEFANGASVDIQGVAKDYVALHRQLEQFRALPVVSKVVFETVRIVENNKVGFTFAIQFSENTLRFR